MRPTFSLWHNPDWDSTVPLTDRPGFHWLRLIELQDLVWVLLFAAIIVLNPEQDPSEIAMLVALAAVQIAESKFALNRSTGKVLWNLLKLVIVLLLIGYTHGVTSPYYLLLLLPMLSAAISRGVVATLVFSVIS